MPARSGTNHFQQQSQSQSLSAAATAGAAGAASAPGLALPSAASILPEWQDPVEFARSALGVELWERQREVLRAVAVSRRVAVKSGNGLGKDFTAAVAMLWYLSCHDPGIVLSTAPTFRQVRHLLWRQVRSLYRGAAQLGGKMLDTRWELSDDRYAMGLSADGADQFQGFHCENMLIVVDEAEGVAETIFEAVEALMTSARPKLLLIGNPTTTRGAFHRAFHQESGIYHTITMSAAESPNVAAGRVIIPGLTTAEWVEERRAIWGGDSPLFRARVLGEFPERDDESLLSNAEIEAAATISLAGSGDACNDQDEAGNAAPAEPVLSLHGLPELWPRRASAVDAPRVVMGVDVARFGSSSSVILVRRGDAVAYMKEFNGIDTMELAGRVVIAFRKWQPERVNVDVVGVGGGVVDELRYRSVPVQEFNGGLPALRDLDCANRRAEGYLTLSRRFREGRIRIPRDPGLMHELAELRYTNDSRGRVLMESKTNLRRRGMRSPDKADALMMAFADDLTTSPGFSRRELGMRWAQRCGGAAGIRSRVFWKTEDFTDVENAG